LHTVEEDRRFIEEVILRECEVTVAEDGSGLVSSPAPGASTRPAASVPSASPPARTTKRRCRKSDTAGTACPAAVRQSI
jgi:hypothetical protein